MYNNSYGQVVSDDYLAHHGILGQKWGQRNGPPYPLGSGDHSVSEKRAGWQKSLRSGRSSGKKELHTSILQGVIKDGHYHRNLDKFTADSSHNVLFITGLSGSGKSTLARMFNGDNIIHLDFYFEKGDPSEDKLYQDAEFNNYMLKHGISFEKIKTLSNGNPEKWRVVDEMGDAIISFAEEQYKKRKAVIVEGVEIANEAMYQDKQFFKDKCLIVLETPHLKSLLRGLKRDGINPFDIVTIQQRIKYQLNWNEDLKKLKMS